MQVYIRLMMLLYLSICLCLLIFNILYIIWLKYMGKSRAKNTLFWTKEIDAQLQNLLTSADVTEKHRKLLNTRLLKTENLIAFNMAVEPQLNREDMQRYLQAVAGTFRNLAIHYLKKDVTERAFFAYVLSLYGRSLCAEGDRLAVILLRYFPDSSIYCRENVLKALYAIGSADGVERAFDWMSQHQISHPSRLLSDGLIRFSGDRLSLANRLWIASQKWEEPYQIAVIQMAAQFTDSFQETFAQLLLSGNFSQEVAFAALRYFRKYPYEPLRNFFQQLVLDESELAIAAANALQAYPGEDTKSVLLKGLCSRNWYVRRNSAGTLVNMGISEEELAHIADKYAKDMLHYMVQLKKAKGGISIA